MTDANKNLATVQSDSLAPAEPAPQSSETVAARAMRTAGARALPIQLTGNVTDFEWAAPTLDIWTTNPSLDHIQVISTTRAPNGVYDKPAVSAKLAIDATNLTNLRNTIQAGMNVQVTYNPDINTATSTNCVNFTYGSTSITLTILPIP
jgi:hypothetical protein